MGINIRAGDGSLCAEGGSADSRADLNNDKIAMSTGFPRKPPYAFHLFFLCWPVDCHPFGVSLVILSGPEVSHLGGSAGVYADCLPGLRDANSGSALAL